MKRKLASIITAIVCVFALGFCALACGSESEINGTYTLYSPDGSPVSYSTYELTDGDFVYKLAGREVSSGTYEVDGDTVTLKSGNAELKGTIVSDGVIELSTGGYLCIEGKTPPADTQD